MKNYLKIILMLITVNILTGCTTKIVVSETQSPILIRQNGTFVSQLEFIDLLNGKTVKHRLNSNVNDYYLPQNLIIIENDNVILFKKELQK